MPAPPIVRAIVRALVAPSRTTPAPATPLPLLEPAPLEWLLDPADPSARLHALRELFDRPASDPDVVELRARVLALPEVQAAFARQQEDGGFGDLRGEDTPRGTAWMVGWLLLRGVPPRDPRLLKAVRALHRSRQVAEERRPDHPDGAFSTTGRPTDVAGCVTGDDLALSLAVLGPIEDNRRAVLWLLSHQRHDGGWLHCQKWNWKRRTGRILRRSVDWPEESDPAVRSCRFGTFRVLRALALLPEELRDEHVRRALARGAEYFLARGITGSLEKPDEDLRPHVRLFNPDFSRLGTPVRQQLDMLAVARVLVDLGHATDPRLARTLQRIRDLQGEDGRWRCTSVVEGMLPAPENPPGQPSKWVTADALALLRRVAHSHGAELTLRG